MAWGSVQCCFFRNSPPLLRFCLRAYLMANGIVMRGATCRFIFLSFNPPRVETHRIAQPFQNKEALNISYHVVINYHQGYLPSSDPHGNKIYAGPARNRSNFARLTCSTAHTQGRDLDPMSLRAVGLDPFMAPMGHMAKGGRSCISILSLLSSRG